MTVLFYVVLVVHVLACLFLIGVVLLQQGKGQDLASAFGGGATQTAFGPRGSANILSRATTILAGVFMVTSLSLSVLRPRGAGFLDQVPAGAPAAPASAPAAGGAPGSAPAAPGSAPAAPGSESSAPSSSTTTDEAKPAAPAPAPEN
jgi:preprotein translocase subunit SecG